MWLVTQPLVHDVVAHSLFMVHLVCTVFSHQYATQLAAVGSSDSLWSKLLLQLLAPPPPSLFTPPHTDEWYVGTCTTSYFMILYQEYECAMTRECPLFRRQNLDMNFLHYWNFPGYQSNPKKFWLYHMELAIIGKTTEKTLKLPLHIGISQ